MSEDRECQGCKCRDLVYRGEVVRAAPGWTLFGIQLRRRHVGGIYECAECGLLQVFTLHRAFVPRWAKPPQPTGQPPAPAGVQLPPRLLEGTNVDSELSRMVGDETVPTFRGV